MQNKVRDYKSIHSDDKITVLCHGVFDILHIGHIRYLQKAKEYGQRLIVSITRDEYINKGPGRPYFSLIDRVNQIAALDCVDLVVISPSATSVEVINQIQPQFYCKGIEYYHQDIAGNLKFEREALETVGGVLQFIDTAKESSTDIFYSNFAMLDEPGRCLSTFRDRYKKNKVFEWLQNIEKLHICVVGEIIIDSYVSCWIENVSSKSPSLSGKYIKTDNYLGGVGVICEMLAYLGAQVTLLTHWGSEQKNILNNHSLHTKASIHNIVTSEVSAPQKTRFIHEDNEQRVFELVNIDPRVKFLEIDLECSAISKQYDLMLIYDFGHGLITDAFKYKLSCNPTEKWVNAQTNSENYGYNLITKYKDFGNFILDRREASLAVGVRGLDNIELFNRLRQRLESDNICLTLGGQGCMFLSGQSESASFPALTADPKDATGAGDAFFLMYALIMKITADSYASAALASVFAAQKVAITGHNALATIDSFKRALATILKDN
jgi:rfaE bifunctional protein nucleotidyltransferase chain/domain